MQQQAAPLVDRRSPYGNSSLRPRRVFGCSGATQSGAEEVPRSQRRRGESRAVIADPRDGHLTIEHAKDSSPGLALPVDRAAVPNRHNPSRRTVATEVFWWNSCQKRAPLQLIRLVHWACRLSLMFSASIGGLTSVRRARWAGNNVTALTARCAGPTRLGGNACIQVRRLRARTGYAFAPRRTTVWAPRPWATRRVSGLTLPAK